MNKFLCTAVLSFFLFSHKNQAQEVNDKTQSVSEKTNGEKSKKQFNVILIVCDDLNDYVSGFKGHPQVKTPNIENFAKTATVFPLAYSNNPVCAPSRASFLTGIYCHNSGNQFWKLWYTNSVLKNSRTLSEHFMGNGYRTIATGKLMHIPQKELWHEYAYGPDYGPFWFDGKKRTAHPHVLPPFSEIGPVDGSFGSLDAALPLVDTSQNKGWIYGSWGKTKHMNYTGQDEKGRDLTPDERNAKWAVEKLKSLGSSSTEPFFMGIGFIRPHTPLHVPQKYFDLFPLDQVELPVLKDNDVEDTFYKNFYSNDPKGPKYFKMLQESYKGDKEGLKRFTQAYLASVAAVDDNIGQVIEAVNNSPFKDNTIIVLTSDHGWNMGEKDYLFKNSLWEESARVPLIIRAPGVSKPGTEVNVPVSLIDIYPTLVDLCGLSGNTMKSSEGAPLDGFSMVPLLRNPKKGKWAGPDAALTQVFGGPKEDEQTTYSIENQHYSVRTKDWRYIRYSDGNEELYNHRKDPYEWQNLASLPEYQAALNSMKAKLKAMIPANSEHLKKVNFGKDK